MAQKIITVILGLIIVGGLAWYFNKNYLQPSTSQENQPSNSPGESSQETEASTNLVYVSISDAKEIWRTNSQKESKKLFTDADEPEKIVKLSNMASSTGEVLGIVAADPHSFTGKLVVINLETAKQRVLQGSFTVPTVWNLSSDGKKLCFTRFSNLEENYGYTLYSEDVSGGSIRELARSESEIPTLAWNEFGTKIAFVKTSGTKTEINLVDINSAKTKVIVSFEGKIIDWLSWSKGDKLIFSLRKVGEENSGEIEIINSEGRNLEKIIDFEGGKAQFIYLDDSWLGYLVAQYKEKINDTTAGQIYLYNLNKTQKIAVQKGAQILGWLK